MKTPLRLLAALATLAFALPAAATTSSTDYTDLWYLPAESGWGVNVIQQGDVVFATFFVYGADGSARWFVMPDGRSVASSPGQNTFTGGLFQTQGTFYGSPWGGPTLNATVGSATFVFNSPTTGTLTYSVNGVNVTKTISRQTWRGNTLTGNYGGGLLANSTQCRNGVANGTIAIFGRLVVGHSNFFNPTFRVEFTNSNGQDGVCTFTGGYAQEGKMGRVNSGTYSCQITGISNPPVGTFTLTQIEANTNGFTARFNGADQNCNYDGFFGGVRDVL
jgi:hypothetical protein